MTGDGVNNMLKSEWARKSVLWAAVLVTATAALGQGGRLRGAAADARADASPPKNTALKIDQGYRLEAGPFGVATTDLTLHDDARDKDLEVRVRVPVGEAGKKLPLVVFSHGMGGSRDAFGDLTEHWASWGYVVILPTHADSVELMRRQGKDLSGFFTKGGATRNVDLVGRVGDMKFVLDALDQVEAKIEALGKGRIDRERIAAAGHSAGAITSQLCMGMKARTKQSPLKAASIGDGRFKTGLIISGQGVNGKWITKDAWEDIKSPLLVITGSEDVASVSDATPETRRHPYEYSPAGDKYLMFIEGATHSSYQGKTRLAILGQKDPPNLGDIQAITAAGTMAFLDAYLGEELGNPRKAKAYLESDRLVEFSGGILEYLRK